MKKVVNGLLILAAVGCGAIPLAASAKGTAEEIARLGKDLTCVGAERAGNKDGTLSEFTGKWQGVPPQVNFKGTGHHPVDPYPDEKPLFTITAANMAQYADRLSEGEKAMFQKYPATFRMPVYPSHRDFRFPDSVCISTKENAANAVVVDDGEGIEGITGGIYFPFPKTGLELLWNSIIPYRAWTEKLVADYALVLANGSISWGRVRSRNIGVGSEPGLRRKTGGPSSYYWNETLLPERDRGEINTGMEFFNFKTNPRQSWRYDPGTRRVRQSPGYGYDMPFPGTGGSVTVDEVRGFNGSPERYEWRIAGKKEIYVPYNTYRTHSAAIKYKDLLTPHHANPDFMRYELHRVWIVEGKLKEGYRHIYGKRVLYIDEDTMFPILADNYDIRGSLWRTSMINYFYAYEMQTLESGIAFYHDLDGGTYAGFNLINEQPQGYILNDGSISAKDFGPEAARRAGQ